MSSQNDTTSYFLDMIRRSKSGKFKIYIGMSAGVGKTFRMLQEAHTLQHSGVDVRIGYIETHNRPETQALVAGLPSIARRTLFYKGKELSELDVQAVINARPDVVLVDELAHSNMQGSKHEKRWQDVLELLEAGINVISAVNIQHIESLHPQVLQVTGVNVSERVPDKVLQRADEVVNIDLTAEELINRLKEGKIYGQDKIATALNHFFRPEQILQLRELALKEVASQVERKVAREVPQSLTLRHERFMACISSNEQTARAVIRKTARLSHYYSSKWYVLYVQTDAESADRIGLARQRHLINNFKLATELGAEIIRVSSNSIAKSIAEVAGERGITTVCIGKPHLTFFKIIMASNIFQALLNKLSKSDIDLIILS